MAVTAPGDCHAPTVLVDTTLLIEQQKGDHRAAPVQSAMRGFCFKGASSYSKLEFKRAWLQRLGYILTQCDEADNVLDVLSIVQRKLGANPQKYRMISTVCEQIFAFLGMDHGTFKSKAALARLRAHCKNAILSASLAYKRMITAEFRGTGCARAEEMPAATSHGISNLSIRRCSGRTKLCRVDDFFRENVAHFKRVAEHINQLLSPSPELQKIRQQILAALEDANGLLDGKGCVRLADALIAVDGKEMDVFAANNDREWVTIAAAMERPLLNPVTGTKHTLSPTPKQL